MSEIPNSQDNFNSCSDREKIFIKVFELGKFYKPAWQHYDNKNTSVRCDRCKATDLFTCIGYEKMDLCLKCASEIETLIYHPKTFKDVLSFFTIKTSMWSISCVDDYSYPNQNETDDLDYGEYFFNLITKQSFSKRSTFDEVHKYIYEHPDLCKIKYYYQAGDICLFD